MPVSDEALRRYKQQISGYRERTSGLLVAVWAGLGGVNDDDVEEFQAATAAPLAGAKQAAVSLAAAFFALALGARTVGVRADEVDVAPDLMGPFLAAWHALKVGRPFDEAKLVGRSTAQAVGFDFVQSTARRTGDRVAVKSGREVRWRRAPGPKACDWCREMARHTWPTAAAADFGHERDGCAVVPVASS